MTESTNDVARELANAGAPSGAVVTADAQSAGRGRRGRVWSAPPGKALLYSAVLSPLRVEHALLPLAVAVAACEALESLSDHGCRIKWPNDVWIDERKVAGILIEARPPEWAVIGVGVNVNVAPDDFPADLRWPAVSVGGTTVAAVRDALSAALGRWVALAREELLPAFRDRDALRGRPVTWEDGEGTAAGIADDGNLLVELDDGDRVSLGSGEVSVRVAER